MVDLLPETFTSAKSANFKFNRAVAAHPPRSSNSVKRSSLNQSNTLLSKLSPSKSFAARNGFLAPSMYTRTLLMSGWPLIVMVCNPSEKLKATFIGQGWPFDKRAAFLASFAF